MNRIALASNEERLARDYEQMKAMIFGDYPVWEDILCYLEELEQELNH